MAYLTSKIDDYILDVAQQPAIERAELARHVLDKLLFSDSDGLV